MKKTTVFAVLMIGAFFLNSCTRSVTPYEAANRSHGKRCMRIQ